MTHIIKQTVYFPMHESPQECEVVFYVQGIHGKAEKVSKETGLPCGKKIPLSAVIYADELLEVVKEFYFNTISDCEKTSRIRNKAGVLILKSAPKEEKKHYAIL